MAPIRTTYHVILTLVVSCRISELLYAESHFSVSYSYSGQNFGCSPWNRSVTLRSAESEHHWLFEDFQPMSSGYSRQTVTWMQDSRNCRK